MLYVLHVYLMTTLKYIVDILIMNNTHFQHNKVLFLITINVYYIISLPFLTQCYTFYDAKMSSITFFYKY